MKPPLVRIMDSEGRTLGRVPRQNALEMYYLAIIVIHHNKLLCIRLKRRLLFIIGIDVHVRFTFTLVLCSVVTSSLVARWAGRDRRSF